MFRAGLGKTMSKAKILFLCTANSARSQLGEALLRHHAAEHFDVYSAGLEAKGINPYTLRVLEELNLDISRQYSKTINEYLGKVNFGAIITVCSNADAQCPTTFLSQGAQRLRWPFDDPAAVQGSDEEKLNAFRRTRDEIQAKILSWLQEQNLSAANVPAQQTEL